VVGKQLPYLKHTFMILHKGNKVEITLHMSTCTLGMADIQNMFTLEIKYFPHSQRQIIVNILFQTKLYLLIHS
jgi:hypothetical protein